MNTRKEDLQQLLVRINNYCVNTTKGIERYFGEPEHTQLIESLQQLHNELERYFNSLE